MNVFIKIILIFLIISIQTNAQTFEELDIGLPNFQDGALAWGDFDNDGDLDLAATGFDNTSGNKVSYIYVNEGGPIFTPSSILANASNGSIEWGDMNGDGNLELLLSGDAAATHIFKIDTSNGSIIDAVHLPVDFGDALWVDYDNDGDLDVHLASRGELHQNNSEIFTLDVTASEGIKSISGGADAAWADYDGDGDKDLVIAGGNFDSYLFRNDNGVFVDLEYDFDATADGQSFFTNGFTLADIKWADYDNDGDPDLLMNGEGRDDDAGTDAKITVMYKNIGPDLNNAGKWLFEQTEDERNTNSRMYEGTHYGSIAWGDFNNDGNRDFFVNGSQGSTTNASDYAAFVYANVGTDTFQLDVGVSNTIRGMGRAASAVGDYDGDGDLDIVQFGYSGTNGGLGYSTRLYKNSVNSVYANQAPGVPQNLRTQVVADSVFLIWDAPVDDRTPSQGLTYNVRVGSAAGKEDIVASHADLATGKLKIPVKGNAESNSFYKLINLQNDQNFFWSVQAVDAGYSGSEFSPEIAFNTFAASIDVISPTAGDTLIGGEPFVIQWNSNNVATVKIDYRLNASAAWIQVVSNADAAAGEFLWSVPEVQSNTAQLRIVDSQDSSIVAVSDGLFKILPRYIEVYHPNGGELFLVDSTYFIDWFAPYTSNFRVEFSSNAGLAWTQIGVVNDGFGDQSIEWKVPNITSLQCLVRVTDLNHSLVQDVSDAFFVISPSAQINLTSPNGGEMWLAQSSHSITWSSTSIISVKLEYSLNSGSSWILISDAVSASTGSFNWTIPNVQSTTCLVRISDVANSVLNDVSDGSFTINKVLADTSGPVLSNFDYSEDELLNTQSPVTVDVTDASEIGNVILLYQKGGDDFFENVSMTNTGGSTYSANIPSFAVTERGVLFYILATDEFNNETVSDTSNIEVTLENGLSNPSSTLAGNDISDYRLFSVPVNLENKSPANFLTINTDFGEYDTENYRMFGYDRASQEIREYPDIGSITPDQGYFLITTDDKVMNSGLGATNDISEPYMIAVPQGWSLIGNPFSFEIPYDSLFTDSDVDFKLWSFEGAWQLNESGLVPWKGYALWVAQATNFYISPGKSGLSKSVAYYDTKLNDAENWLVKVKAVSTKNISTFNFFGQDENALDGFDEFDLSAPPVLKGQLAVHFPQNKNPEKMQVADIRKPSDRGHSWPLLVETAGHEKIDLIFEGIEDIPEKFDIFLLDKKTKTPYNLRNSNELQFAVKNISQKDFEVYFGSQEYLESLQFADLLYPEKFSLNQNFPNPFNPVTQITFTLSKASPVKLEVFSLLGQHSETLVDGFLQKGTYSSVWDATRFSSGIYFFKLTAGTYSETKRGVLIK
ncbi:MAG: T9SS type A sorting domain-containing protein [Calditrichaeota bacterium]|nr:T9SS type A sorting domain-containing protein [Calditrichota bacterium]